VKLELALGHLDEIIDMVAVRHGHMAAIVAADAAVIMAGTFEIMRTAVGMVVINGNDVFFPLIIVVFVKEMAFGDDADAPVELNRKGCPVRIGFMMVPVTMRAPLHGVLVVWHSLKSPLFYSPVSNFNNVKSGSYYFDSL
jgi:hypothetical protein